MGQVIKCIDGTTFEDPRPTLREWVAQLPAGAKLVSIHPTGEETASAVIAWENGETKIVAFPVDGGTMSVAEFRKFVGTPARKVFHANREKTQTKVFVRQEYAEHAVEREFDPAPSLALQNHSPAGFEWAYGGSGPAQLALAILLDVFGAGAPELEMYQDFKWKFVANFNVEKWELSEDDIRQWFRANQKGELL